MTVVLKALRGATFASLCLAAAAAGQTETSANADKADAPAVAAVNPTPHSEDAVRKGRTHYLRSIGPKELRPEKPPLEG